MGASKFTSDTMVARDRGAGDPGPRSPATMGFLPIFQSSSSRRFLDVSRLFRFCFLLYFSSTFLLIYWLDSTEENPSRSRANQRTKFLTFGKAEDSGADFPPRVETRSNDVKMTWNLR
ncbi:hypothetical protein AAC387_Pa10g0863 [Persea americana]